MLKGYSLALNWLWLQIRFLKLDTQRRQRSCDWKWSLLDKARVFFRLKCLSRVNSLILWRGCEKSFPFQCRRPVSAMRLPFPEWLASGLPPLPVPIAMFEALEGTCWSPYVSLVDFHGFMATCSSGDINIPPTFLPQPARLTFELLEVRVLPLGFDQLEGRRLLGCITNHRKNHHGYIFYNDVHIFVTHHSSPCMRRLWSCCQSTTTIVYIGPVRTPEGRVPQGFAAENPGKVGSKDRNKPDELWPSRFGLLVVAIRQTYPTSHYLEALKSPRNHENLGYLKILLKKRP